METRVCKCCGKELSIEQFCKNHFGYTYVCKECNHINRSNARKESYQRKKESEQKERQIKDMRQMRLQDFEPIELMRELKRRGYKFTMTFTKVYTISSDKIDD